MPSGDPPASVEVPWNDALPTASLPRVDFSLLSSPDPSIRAPELAKLGEAAKTVGFFLLANPPFGRGEVAEQFDLAEGLFKLPAEEKEPYNMGVKGEFAGYKTQGQMLLGPDGRKDINESYQIRKFVNGDGGDQPAFLEENKESIERFQRKCHSTCLSLLRSLAAVLGIPEDHFDPLHRYEAKCGSVLRYVRYPAPPPESEDDPEGRRMAQHTDLGTITLLWSTEGVGGLQVLSPQGEWEWVKPQPGCAIVNLGDSIAAWTGGALKSNLHRVVRPPPGTPQVGRYTVVYFVRPEDDVPMSPIPGFGETDPAQPVKTAKEWISNRVKNLMVKNDGGNWKEFEKGAKWAGQEAKN
ncbi:hypothetical protein DFJ74DRAFT_679595 [Hyaloraphidium curvatum]|nr:hypothetical protein DFJ74DRAFT_679595 [Hyaloraphidium curvatum]